MKVSGYWLLSLLKKQFLCTHQILMSHLIRQLKQQKVWLIFPFIWKWTLFSMFRNFWVHVDLGICKTFADMAFNVAWLRGGHPLLNVGDLAMEASQSLGLLLEQLKSPKVKSLSTSMIIVFVTRFASYFTFVLLSFCTLQFVPAMEQLSFLWMLCHLFS